MNQIEKEQKLHMAREYLPQLARDLEDRADRLEEDARLLRENSLYLRRSADEMEQAVRDSE